MKSRFGTLLAAALLTACSGSGAGDAVNIQDLNQQFISAWNNKDADKTTALLADDVQFLQGGTRFNGKSEVSDKWVKSTLGTITDLKTNVVSSGTDTHLAYEAGTFSVDVVPTAANQPRGFGEGNFILLWKKAADGNWKTQLRPARRLTRAGEKLSYPPATDNNQGRATPVATLFFAGIKPASVLPRPAGRPRRCSGPGRCRC